MAGFVNKSILVTGGMGFIGSHLVESLVNKKAKVIVPLRSINPKSYFNFKNLGCQVIQVVFDIKDFKRLLDVLCKYEVDYVFHLAAQPLVEKAFYNPLGTIEDNIIGTANILEAARIYGQISGVIVSSSDKAYGKTKKKYKETDRLHGDHPYEVSKSSADLIAQSYFKTYNLAVGISRFGNVFGPGDMNFDRIIPGILEAVIKNKILKIRSDGQYVRNYIYVKDVVAAYISLFENFEKIKGEAFNFGTYNIFSVLGLIKEIESILKVKVKYKILNKSKNEIPYQVLNWQKAKKKLGWKPKVGFSKAILKSYNWYRNYYFGKNR